MYIHTHIYIYIYALYIYTHLDIDRERERETALTMYPLESLFNLICTALFTCGCLIESLCLFVLVYNDSFKNKCAHIYRYRDMLVSMHLIWSACIQVHTYDH